MLSRVTHMTILSVFTCVVNVRNQYCQLSVTCLSPFCDYSCTFVDRPQECLVFQFVPGTSISKQFVSMRVTVLRLIQVLPVWIDDHPSKDLKLWKTAPLSCLPMSQHRSTHFRACPSISQDKLHIGYNRCPSKESWQLSKYEPRTTKLTQEPNQCHVTRTNIEKAEHHDSQAEKLARLTGGPHYAPLLRPDQCMLCHHIGHHSSECSNKVDLLSPGNLRSGMCGVWCHVFTVLTAEDVRCSVIQPNTSRKFVRSGNYPYVPSKNQQGVEKVRSW